MLRRAATRLRPDHWVYLLLHLVILFIGLMLVTSGGAVAISVGTSLMAAAFAGWVLFLRIWLSEDQVHLWELHSKFGLSRGFQHRSIAIKHEYDAHVDNAAKAIDVMGFGLRSLRQDYIQQFAAWTRRAEVRVLLIDPEFMAPAQSLADQRDAEENEPLGTIAQDVRTFVRDNSDLIRSNPVVYPENWTGG